MMTVILRCTTARFISEGDRPSQELLRSQPDPLDLVPDDDLGLIRALRSSRMEREVTIFLDQKGGRAPSRLTLPSSW